MSTPPLKLHRPWLTRAEAASRARVDVRTIDRWLRDNKIRKYHTVTGRVRISTRELDRLMQPQRGEER